MRKSKKCPVPTKRATRAQTATLFERMDALVREDKLYGALYDMLLQIGGDAVAAVQEADLEKLLHRGYLQSGRGAELLEGQPIQCHANAAFMWADHPERLGIVTGYALSADGIWRQHSWLRDLVDGHILETTQPRQTYFGFDLTPEESQRFYTANAHV